MTQTCDKQHKPTAPLQRRHMIVTSVIKRGAGSDERKESLDHWAANARKQRLGCKSRGQAATNLKEWHGVDRNGAPNTEARRRARLNTSSSSVGSWCLTRHEVIFGFTSQIGRTILGTKRDFLGLFLCRYDHRISKTLVWPQGAGIGEAKVCNS